MRALVLGRGDAHSASPRSLCRLAVMLGAAKKLGEEEWRVAQVRGGGAGRQSFSLKIFLMFQIFIFKRL